jgi:hypothetical protein
MSQIDTALRATFLTLRDSLPARLAAADATRAATIRCAAGPYTLPTGVLTVAGEDVAITAGTYTAAALAALIVVDSVTASDEAGRLVLTGPAPQANLPSVVKVGGGAVAAALGLLEEAGFSEEARLAIGSPAPLFLERQVGKTDLAARPIVALAGSYIPTSRPVLPLSTGLHTVTLRLTCTVPGWSGLERATQEAAGSLMDEVIAVLLAGDGRGSCLVGGPVVGANICRATPRGPLQEVTATSVDSTVGPIPVGVAVLDIEVEVLS